MSVKVRSNGRAERPVEGPGAGRQGVDLRVRAVRVRDVPVRAPHRQVVREQHVGGELVAQPDDRLGEPGGGVREAGQRGVAGARDGRRDLRGVVVRGGRLLDVAPQVGLDMEDHWLRAGGPLEEQAQVRVPGRHRGGVREVGDVLGLFGAAGRRVRLEEHVVREHRDGPVVGRVRDVPADELAVRVPGGPAVPGVHAAREVLVAELEGRGGAERRRAARRVREAELDPVGRPRGRERRERAGGARRRGRRGGQPGEHEDDGDEDRQAADGRDPPALPASSAREPPASLPRPSGPGPYVEACVRAPRDGSAYACRAPLAP